MREWRLQPGRKIVIDNRPRCCGVARRADDNAMISEKVQLTLQYLATLDSRQIYSLATALSYSPRMQALVDFGLCASAFLQSVEQWQYLLLTAQARPPAGRNAIPAVHQARNAARDSRGGIGVMAE